MMPELYRKGIFTLIFLVLIAVSFFIIKPYLTAVLMGMIFSYIFYPLYLRINRRISSKNLSSLIASILVVLIITLPLFFVLNTVSKEAYATYLLSRQMVLSGQFLTKCEPAGKIICKAINYITDKANQPQVRYYFDTSIKSIAGKVTKDISNILFSFPALVLDTFIILFVMFFLFKDGKIFVNKIENMLPMKPSYRKYVIKRLNDMASAVIYGSLIIAIAQGTLGGIGFFIFGLPSPLLWGIIMIFASLLPYIGTSVIWLPAALFLILNGYANMETALITKGLLLMLYGIFIIGTIDNILKPKLIGDRSGLHPVLVLLSVVGGINFLGFIGVIIGPMIIAALVTFINIYEEEKG